MRQDREINDRTSVGSYSVKGINKLVDETLLLSSSKVKLTFSLDPFGVSKIEKAELVLTYIPIYSRANNKLECRTNKETTGRYIQKSIEGYLKELYITNALR